MVKLKNRYFLLEVVLEAGSTVQPNDAEIYRAIMDAVGEIHGDYGVGAALQSLKVNVFNPETSILVLRIAKHAVELVASAIPFVSRVGKQCASLKTIHHGASIRSCERRLLRYHRMNLIGRLPLATTDVEKKCIQSAIIQSCQKSSVST